MENRLYECMVWNILWVEEGRGLQDIGRSYNKDLVVADNKLVEVDSGYDSCNNDDATFLALSNVHRT